MTVKFIERCRNHYRKSETGFPSNIRPIDFSITTVCILIAKLLMVLLFSSWLNRMLKKTENAKDQDVLF
jgi:hypothetical protein